MANGTKYCPKCGEYKFVYYPPHEDETSAWICSNCKYVKNIVKN